MILLFDKDFMCMIVDLSVQYYSFVQSVERIRTRYEKAANFVFGDY